MHVPVVPCENIIPYGKNKNKKIGFEVKQLEQGL